MPWTFHCTAHRDIELDGLAVDAVQHIRHIVWRQFLGAWTVEPQG